MSGAEASGGGGGGGGGGGRGVGRKGKRGPLGADRGASGRAGAEALTGSREGEVVAEPARCRALMVVSSGGSGGGGGGFAPLSVGV